MFNKSGLSTVITKKRIAAGAIIAVVLIVISTIIWFFTTNNGTIIVTVVPSDATVSINGNPAQHGENIVTPGSYQINIRREGFDSVQESIIVKRGDKIYIDKIMGSDDQTLVDDMLNQADNQQNIQSIVSRDYTSESDKFETEFPIAKDLGSYDAMWGFEVSYGKSQSGNGYALFVNLLNSSAKQKFLDWLSSLGYSENTLEIHYVEKWR